ncbi:type II toxin-antitoxin system RelE/ParE family toxin [Bradyrhizobium sp. WSM 1704]|uniref:type II toxin-antitoxin system RelE/ParE family toxin n=1 Tax=Bradyrhizobium semiaridum TaxID=2821404 RepID=UPI001CE386D6|nr:type II toxin-antitoxin system RelE/ParE family toxin [Bradyrhizobium semiaridum]
MKLRFARRARNDIDQIHDYISEHSRRAATAVVRQIRLTIELLARYPGLAGKPDIPEVRVLPTSRYPYLVYHRVTEHELIILHIRHGRRDVPKAGDL